MSSEVTLYNMYFLPLRKQLRTRRDLNEDEIIERVKTVLDERLNETDRYFLRMYAIYKSYDRLSKMTEVDPRRVRRKYNLAVKHLVTPSNANLILFNNRLFKHTGESLTLSNCFTTRTINALKAEGIVTGDDLMVWFRMSSTNLFRIPNVGQTGIIEILNYFRS